MRRFPSVLLGTILLLGTTSTALAGGKPAIEPVPFPAEGILLPGGVFCDFDLFAEATRNTELAKTFPADADGRVLQIVTGQLWVLLTNLDTGAAVEVNISGPSRYVIDSDGTIHATQLGRLVAVQPGGFLVYSGRVIQIIHPDGSADILSTVGASLDICALLSAD